MYVAEVVFVAVQCKWNFPILHQLDYLSPGTLVCTTFTPPPTTIPLQTPLRSLVTTGKVILTETSLYLKWLRLNICPSRKLRFELMVFCDGKCAISCTLEKPKQIIKELCKDICISLIFSKGLAYFPYFPASIQRTNIQNKRVNSLSTIGIDTKKWVE